jgi:hypothetical protein
MKNLFATQVTESSHVDVEGVGSIRIEADGKMYRWVKNTSTTITPAAGDAVFHDYSEGADAMKSVIVAATADLGFLAGIVASTTIAANTGTNPKCYGWIQIFGYALANILGDKTTAFAAGHHVKGVDANVYLVFGTALGTAPLYRRSVMLLDALATMTTAATTFVKGFIHCV